MLVIVEGPDGTGKTTLVKKLKEHGYKTFKFNRYENISQNELYDLAVSEKTYVFDREFLSSWAYRLLDSKPLDEDDCRFPTMLFFLEYSRIIYCKNNKAFQLAMNRGETNITDVLKHTKLTVIYEFIIATLKLYDICPIMEYDFDKQDENEGFQNIVNFIKGGEQE